MKTTTDLSLGFVTVLNKFYLKITLKHSKCSLLKERMTVFKDKMTLILQNDTSSFRQSNFSRRMSAEEDRISVKSARSNSRRLADISPDFERNPDTKKISEQKQLFGVDWVYESPYKSHAMLFALLSCFILRSNSMGFTIFHNNLRQCLQQAVSLSQEQRQHGWRYWQKIADIIKVKQTSLKWQKSVKDHMLQLPHKFIQVAINVYFGELQEEGGVPNTFIERVLSQGVPVGYFVVYFGELQITVKEGYGQSEICMGYLRHMKRYVISSKLPVYKEAHLRLRRIKQTIHEHLSQALKEMTYNSKELESLGGQKTLQFTTKDKIVTNYLNDKIKAIQSK